MLELNHRHIMVTARNLACPPTKTEEVSDWLIRLVSAVEMIRLMGPFSIRCNIAENEGCTGVIVITTSHASIHCWDYVDEPFLRMDLYSCADFESESVLELIREFMPEKIEWMVVDRNDQMRVIESGIEAPYAGFWGRLWLQCRHAIGF